MDNLYPHFVISAPRSGSTWLTTALNHHPNIFATEHRLFGQFCQIWNNNDGSTAPRLTFDSYADAFAMHYFYRFLDLDRQVFIDEFQIAFAKFLVDFARQRSGKNIIVDKITPYPGTTNLVIDQIKKLFPNSKIVQLVRDGRDVLTSGTFDWLLKDAIGTPRHDFFVQQLPGMTLRRFFDDDVIETWARNWRETVDAFSSSNQHTRVTFEQMKTDLAGELTKFLTAVGADVSPEILRQCADETTFEKMSGRPAGSEEPTAKARKGIVGDWKNYFTRADGELFDQLAGEQLIDTGYETNRDWTKALPKELALVN